MRARFGSVLRWVVVIFPGCVCRGGVTVQRNRWALVLSPRDYLGLSSCEGASINTKIVSSLLLLGSLKSFSL